MAVFNPASTLFVFELLIAWKQCSLLWVLHNRNCLLAYLGNSRYIDLKRKILLSQLDRYSMVFSLKREEAILVLKELFEKCTFLDGHYLSLTPAGYANSLSKGYQIVIKCELDEETRTCMQDILMKNKLSIKIKEADTFIIYRPTQTRSQGH